MRPFPFEKDPVIEAYKKDVDRTLIVENLRRTPEARFRTFENFMEFTEELRRMGRQLEPVLPLRKREPNA